MCFNSPDCVVLMFTPAFNSFVANLRVPQGIQRQFNESAFWSWKLSAAIHYRPHCFVKIADIQITSPQLDLTILVDIPANRIGGPDYLLVFGRASKKFNSPLWARFPAATTSKLILIVETIVEGEVEEEVFMVCIICGPILRTIDELHKLISPPLTSAYLKVFDVESISSLHGIYMMWSRINSIRPSGRLKTSHCDILHGLGTKKLREMVKRLNFNAFSEVARPETCVNQLLSWRLNCSGCMFIDTVIHFGTYEMYKWPYWEMSPYGTFSHGFGYALFVGKDLATMNDPWYWSAAFLLEQGTSLKSNWRNVHLIILWFFAALLFRNAYTGSMYSNLTSKPTQQQLPETLEEVVKHEDFEVFAPMDHFSRLKAQIEVIQKEFNNTAEFLKVFDEKLAIIIPKIISMVDTVRKNGILPGGRARPMGSSTENFAYVIEKGGISNFISQNHIVGKDLLMVFGNKKVVFNNHLPFLTTLQGWTLVRNGFMDGAMGALKSYIEAGLDFHTRDSLKILFTTVYLKRANLDFRANKTWNFFKISSLPLNKMWEESPTDNELLEQAEDGINSLESLWTVWIFGIKRLFNESEFWHWKLLGPIHYRPHCFVKVADIQITTPELDLTILVDVPANRIGAPDYLLVFVKASKILNSPIWARFPAATTSKMILILETKDEVGIGIFMVCIICGPILRTIDELHKTTYYPLTTAYLEIIDVANISSLHDIHFIWSRINNIRPSERLKTGHCDILYGLGTKKLREMVNRRNAFRSITRPETCVNQLLSWRLNCTGCMFINTVMNFGTYEMYKWPYWEMSPYGAFSIGFGYALFVGKDLATVSKVVILQSLDIVTWISIIIAYIWTNVALSWTKMSNPWYWSAAFLLEQGTSLKSNWRNVHLISLWFFTALLFRNAYTGSMYSNLTSKPTQQQLPGTLEEVVKHEKFEVFATWSQVARLQAQIKATQKEVNNTGEFSNSLDKKLAGILTGIFLMVDAVRKNSILQGGRGRPEGSSTENFAFLIDKGGIPSFNTEGAVVGNDLLMVFGNKKVVFNNHVPLLITLHGWTVVRNGFMGGAMRALKSYIEAGFDFHTRDSLKILFTTVYLKRANLAFKTNKTWNFFKISTLPLNKMWEEAPTDNELLEQAEDGINRLESLWTVWILYGGCLLVSTMCLLSETLIRFFNRRDINRLFNESQFWNWKLSAPIHYRPHCLVKVADLNITSTVLDLTTFVEIPANRIGAPDYILVFGRASKKLTSPPSTRFPTATTTKIIFIVKTKEKAEEGIFMVCIICGPILRKLNELQKTAYYTLTTAELEVIDVVNISSLHDIHFMWSRINSVEPSVRLQTGACDTLYGLGSNKLREMVPNKISAFFEITHPETCVNELFNWRLNCSRCMFIKTAMKFESYQMYKWPYWEMSPYGAFSIGFGYTLFVGKNMATVSKIAILQSLDILMWISIMFAYVGTNVALIWTKINNPWYWSAAFLLEQATMRQKVSWRNVHLITLWFFSALLFRNAYTGSMYSNLTSKSTQQQFPETLEEVVKHEKFEVFATTSGFNDIKTQIRVTQKEFNNTIEYLKVFEKKLAMMMPPKIIHVVDLVRKNGILPGGRRGKIAYPTENFAYVNAKGGMYNFRFADDIVAKDLLTL
ncbi:unnamed protein product [Orchesella dallaii]|uniref:Uncharacterized protein n=1 Tax=Orchesella dallaii TaxID=48710 RepID=A0ABP1S162_9HEXA